MIFHLNMYFSSTTLVTLSLLSLLSLFSSQVQADGHQSKSPSHHQLRLRQYADHPDWWALTFSTLHSRISSSVHNLTFLTLTSASPTGLTWTQCRGSNLTLPNRTMPGTIPLPQFPWALFIYEPKYPAHLRFDSNKPPPHLSPHHDHTSAYIRIRIESCDLTLPFLCTSPNRLHSYLSMAAYGNYEVTCPQTFLRGFTVLQKFKNGFVAQVPEMVSRLIFPFLK